VTPRARAARRGRDLLFSAVKNCTTESLTRGEDRTMSLVSSRFRGCLGVALALALALSAPAPARAQSLNLRDLLTDFLRQGITLAPPAVGTNHAAHFIGEDSPQFGALELMSTEIARQLSSYPLSSSAGGFAYELDPDLGVFVRQSNSFGSIFTERPLTLGKGRYNLGVNFSQFTFDYLDDLSLRDGDMRLVFTHLDTNGDGSTLTPFVEGDVITARMFLSIRTNITSFVGAFGVTDRLDVGIAIPVVSTEIDASADAHIERLATGDGEFRDTHTFSNGADRQIITKSGDDEGLGDIVLRAKLRVADNGRSFLALAADARLPTGDERNLLGTGAFWAKGSIIGSVNTTPVSPHVNVGYVAAGRDFPNEIHYLSGIDWAVDERLTIAADMLGKTVSELRRADTVESEFDYNPNPTGPPAPDTARFPILSVGSPESATIVNGSIGLKLNVTKTVLVTYNGLFPLTDRGLRDEFTSLVGVDYSF